MKNYPNQASSFWRLRDTLQTIDELNTQGLDVDDDGVLGYAAARKGAYTFRGLVSPTPQDLDARIATEKQKPSGSQGARTFARELRRTLRDMGWLDGSTQLTADGRALLDSEANSVEEQALLVEGLLNIEAIDRDGHAHHPVRTMLQLLAHKPSMMRMGLELALEPEDDSAAELARITALYDMKADDRLQALDITDFQRANAVKIFPTLSEYAGLVVEEDGLWSLSQDGWRVLGLPQNTPAQAAQAIRQRRGRRTTVGRLVNIVTAGQRRATRPPRALTPEEQQRAYERLAERTDAHQGIVRRIWSHIGQGRGDMFEDEFSYDLLFVPSDEAESAVLFEMKSITNETDAYARVRHAVGQLVYYEYFNVAPSLNGRSIDKIAAFDSEIPEPLVEYLTALGIGALHSAKGAGVVALNPLGQAFLDRLQ